MTSTHTATVNIHLENNDGKILHYSNLNKNEKRKIVLSIKNELEYQDDTYDFNISPDSIITYSCVTNNFSYDDFCYTLSGIDEDANTIIRNQYFMVFTNIVVDGEKTRCKSSSLRQCFMGDINSLQRLY